MKKINFSLILFLIFSLIFIIPYNLGNIYGAGLEGTPDKKENVQNTCGGNTANLDIKGSIILSAVTLCLPGIMEKAKEHKDYKCKQIVCTYDAVKAGLDPSFCAKEYEYNTCKFIVGEVFAIPPMAILEYYRGIIAGLLENPIGILWSAGTMYARGVVSKACSVPENCHWGFTPEKLLYTTASTFLVVTDSVALAQQLQQIFEQGFDYFNGAPNYCERVPEIRKEMEKIVKYA